MTPNFLKNDILTYTRTNGEEREGRVMEAIDLDDLPTKRTRQWSGAHPQWPKERHCRFVYRLDIEGIGPRTVCGCRLSSRAEGGSGETPTR